MLSIDEAIANEIEMAEGLKEQYECMMSCSKIFREQKKVFIEQCKHDSEEHEQLAEWLEELKAMRKNQGQIADFWYQEGISRESKLIFDKIEEIKNRYNVEDFAIIGVLIKVQEIALEIAEQLKEGRNNENYNKEES